MPTDEDKTGTSLSTIVRAVCTSPLAAIVAVHIAIGCAWLLWLRPVPFSDYHAYFKLAAGLVDEQQFGYPLPTARRLPGFPALLVVPMLISRSYLWLGFFNVLLSAALLPVVHRLTWSISHGDHRVALTAPALCALNPTFVFLSPVLASEHLFVLLLFSALAILFSQRLGRNVAAAISGVLLGLAALTRGEAMFYLPVALFVAAATTKGGIWQRIVRAGVVVVVSVAIMVPWAVRNRIVIGPGAVLSSVAGENFYFAHNPDVYGHHRLSRAGLDDPNEAARQKVWFRRGWANIADNPSRLLEDVQTGTYQLVVEPGRYAVWAATTSAERGSPDQFRHRRKYPWGTERLVVEFYRVIALMSVLGLLFVRRIGKVGFVALYGVVFMNWVCYAVVFWGKPRYRYTAEVVMCIVAAFVLWGVWGIVTALIRRAVRAKSTAT